VTSAGRLPAFDPSLTRLPPFWPGMRVGILGGSFDPPHAGHREVSLVALRTLALDQVWWLVSPHNPLKPHQPSADLRRRIETARALAHYDRIKVTGVEAALGTRYTADTLTRLAPRLKGLDLVWLMGADNLASFHRWQHWDAIAASIPIAVFNRPGWSLRALNAPAAHALAPARIDEKDAAGLAKMRPPAWVFIQKPMIDLSSTALRAAGRRHPGPS
jgi:nicotinate-nucleotide adenylyltransferase